MSTIGSADSKEFARPRPGVVTALGICNIVFSVVTGICVFSTTFWWFYVSLGRPKVEVQVTTTKTAGPPAGSQPVVAFNPLMGMDDPKFFQFSLIDAGTALIFNGIMLATGIGLVNLRRWAARWWTYLAFAKLARLLVIWGYFIVAVAPSLSESMARSAIAMLPPQAVATGRGIAIADLARVYSFSTLFMALAVIVLGSIYPAISLWLISRPGVKAALIDKSPSEPELT